MEFREDLDNFSIKTPRFVLGSDFRIMEQFWPPQKSFNNKLRLKGTNIRYKLRKNKIIKKILMTVRKSHVCFVLTASYFVLILSKSEMPRSVMLLYSEQFFM